MQIDRNQIRDIVSKVVSEINDNKKISEVGTSFLPQKKISLRTGNLFGIYEDVETAIKKAKEAQACWINLPLQKRHDIIEKIRAKLRTAIDFFSNYAVEETGLGRFEDKVNKNRLVIDKTPGIEYLKPNAFSGDYGLTIEERAPYGVIGAITPCTNASETIICNGIGMIAGGNAVVFNAHPTAKKTSNLTIDMINRVIHENGGPDSLLAAKEIPTIDSANKLMKHPDICLLVVTGGPGVVQAAMGSGKKTIAGGPGNPPVLVDETADFDLAGKKIVQGHSLDNNIVCIAEKEVFVLKSVAEKLKKGMLANGAYELPTSKLRALEKIVLDKGHPNKNFVGKNASVILNAAGISTREDYRTILIETDFNHPFVQEEMLMPVLPMIRVNDVDEGIKLSQLAEHNFRHTAVIHSKNIEHMDKMAKIMNCSIFVKNAPSYAGLGFNGEGFTSFTIASPTGEGLTTVKDFTRVRRCTLADYFRIV
ncbi:MAG: aldehyde dehydrogenase family protein [Pseudomonadota bacterium]